MRVTVACAAVVVAAGCGSDAVAGSPTAAPAELFDTCSISPEALTASDVNPVSVGEGFFGVEDDEWKPCDWDGGWYYLTVLSTSHTLQEIKDNPRSTDIAKVSVGSRDAVSYYDDSDPEHRVCDVAFPSGRGAVVVRISTKLGEAVVEPPCDVAVRTANALDSAIPQ
jgi:hypothetical protein